MSVSARFGVIADQLTKVLREAFEGPPGPWSYFTDRFPESGLFGTIGRLSAAQASRPAGVRRTTIAGHVQHLCFSLALATRWIRGELTARDRNAGWSISGVDEAGWKALQARLRREYETLCVTIGTQPAWGEEPLGGAVGAIAHAAYHLGALRQRLLLEGTRGRSTRVRRALDSSR